MGNALVCMAVYTNYTMRTVTNIFIVNLAVADFFVILFCLPPTVVWDVTKTWFMGEAMCKVVLYFQVRIHYALAQDTHSSLSTNENDTIRRRDFFSLTFSLDLRLVKRG